MEGGWKRRFWDAFSSGTLHLVSMRIKKGGAIPKRSEENILILGGGVSGLVAAWELQKKFPPASITLFEAKERLGGLIQTDRDSPFFFEKGPRTFAFQRSEALLRLIEELGLQEEILFSDKNASKRYLWHRQKLQSLSSLSWRLLFPLLREMGIPKGIKEETIQEFAQRRFRSTLVQDLFDAMSLGVFGAPASTLSFSSCFPKLLQMEQTKGSLTKALLLSPRKKGGLFTLRSGMQTLIDALEKKLFVQVEKQSPIETLSPDGVHVRGKFWKGDQIFSALPGPAIGKLTGLWPNFPTVSLWVVSLVFPPKSLSKKGFGYLIPSRYQQDLLGMVFDSEIFPSQSKGGEVRLTAMLHNRGDLPWALDQAQQGAKEHLHIDAPPLWKSGYLAEEAIPHFFLGYGDRLAQFQRDLKENFPNLSLLGSYIQSPAVDSCVSVSSNLY